MVEQCSSEWDELCADYSNLEKQHEDYLHKLQELTKMQQSCLKALKHHGYLMSGIRTTMTTAERSAATDEERQKLKDIQKSLTEQKARLRQMHSELPVQDNGFYLSLILGSNLNLSLLSSDSRYKYKQDYEDFKWKVTVAVLTWSVVAFLFPWRVIDSIGLFLMVWYYCTLTIRESILRINGSRIKGWWVLHHYISLILCGIVLIWKDGTCYQSFRMYFLCHVIYICLVQILQSQYQSGCLRRLHALGQGHQMDITVEGFTGFMFKGLTFLLPFLMVGYFSQLYNGYILFTMSGSEVCKEQWQVEALCFLFFFIAIGNISTTSLVIFRKFRSSGSYANLIALTNKYRIRVGQNKDQ